MARQWLLLNVSFLRHEIPYDHVTWALVTKET
jgi:hypothetical protein